MRLDQFVSQALGVSRSDAKRLIKNKHIRIDDHVCRDAAQHVVATQTVYCDEQTLSLQGEYYYVLHKPQDYVCSHEDDGYPSALRLLPDHSVKLHFAGRLDAKTTGLVLLSSDGQWCHRVTSPNSKKQKCYRVTLADPLTDDAIATLEKGVLLHSETKPTEPCCIARLSENSCEIAISEGKYHQVRRMFAAVGNHVIGLHRYRIGTIDIDQMCLPEGEYRRLHADEVSEF